MAFSRVSGKDDDRVMMENSLNLLKLRSRNAKIPKCLSIRTIKSQNFGCC